MSIEGGTAMYWWNVSKLAGDFQQDRVDEKERFKYYLAYVTVVMASTELGYYLGRTFTVLSFIDSAATIAISIIGIVVCYRVNQNGDDRDFIGRMICLGWPIFIKLTVLLVIGYLFFFFVNEMVAGRDASSDLAGDILGVVARIFFVICYYWMLYKYVNIAAQYHMVKNLEL